MNKIPIVFAFDGNFVLPASIAIQSLIDNKNKSTEYKIFVIHDDLDETVKRQFETITKINWIRVDSSILDFAPSNSGWPKVVYYRLLIPQLLNDIDKAIYSDVDVLFKCDLSEVFNQNIKGSHWAGVTAEKNEPDLRGHKYFPENKNDYIYWSGFMLMNLAQMRKDKIVDKMFDNLKLLKDRLQFYDLELLNITCDKISGLPLEYCVIERLYTEGNIRAIKEYPFLKTIYSDDDLLKAKQNPKIIHFCGKCPKIWKRKTKDIPQYYLKYIKRSPFYDKNLFFPSVKGMSFKFLLFLLSKFSFSRNVRHKYRRQLREFRLIPPAFRL